MMIRLAKAIIFSSFVSVAGSALGSSFEDDLSVLPEISLDSESFEGSKARDPLKWCSSIPFRNPVEVEERIFQIEAPIASTASKLDIVGWLAESARTGKTLILDERYGSCLGCMNRRYNEFMADLKSKQKILYAVVDFEDISGLEINQADVRRPYNSIVKELGYQFTQFLTLGKNQIFNKNKIIESYPLVQWDLRDNEENAIEEDQENRIYTRAHFPNIMMIDGNQINKGALNNLCFQAQFGPEIRMEENAQGIFEPISAAHKRVVSGVLPYGSMLLQLIGPNLYFVGTEDSADFNAVAAMDAIDCALNNLELGIRSDCELFNRFEQN